MAISKAVVIETLKEKGFTCQNIQDYKTLDSILKIKCAKGHEIEAPFKVIRDNRFTCKCCEGESTTGTLFFNNKPPQKSGKRIIAIDNATKHMGLSMYDNGKLVFYTLVDFEGETIERLLKNRKFLENTVIKEWKPDLIILEDIQSQKNVQIFKILSMLLGSTVTLFKEYNIPYELVGSTKWRAHFMISGERISEKVQAINMVTKMYNVSVSDDIAEAILLGKYGVDIINATKPIKLF